MVRAIVTSVVMVVVLGACGSDATNVASSSAVASGSAPASAKQAASAASAAPSAMVTASASASAAANPCDVHGLTPKGAGTREDMCKYDEDILTSSYEGAIRADGMELRIANPWSEDVTWISGAVFYYDKAGKQLTVTADGKEHRSAKVEKELKIINGSFTDEPLGFAQKDLPEGAYPELQVLAFGINAGGGKTTYFSSTKPYRDNRPVRGGDGPTGIAECDEYRALLETCPKKFPDALTAMRKSIRGYNHAAPATQEKLSEPLKTQCVAGIAQAKARCTPD